MLFTIIIFFIAIIIVFGMLAFRAWEIRTMKKPAPDSATIANQVPDLSFGNVKKNILYLTKHVLQSIVLVVAKYWFIIVAKTKKWISDNWPKANSYLNGNPDSIEGKKLTFFQKAVLESKAKIKRIKEKVKKEHGEIEEVEENKI